MDIRTNRTLSIRTDGRSRNTETTDREVRITIVGGTLVAPLVRRIVVRMGVGAVATIGVLALLAHWLF